MHPAMPHTMMYGSLHSPEPRHQYNDNEEDDRKATECHCSNHPQRNAARGVVCWQVDNDICRQVDDERRKYVIECRVATLRQSLCQIVLHALDGFQDDISRYIDICNEEHVYVYVVVQWRHNN